ncbi:MAG: iron-containing alcohol dehydrogenase [Roseburia sp.]|nr:iron-containing alcohol dehydrogenase [Anaeroplasma bactoclasticum]MCM1197046.1 iron-containing alcohol dehydrogenase [Roseburia sp.]MCM1557428.1 iron-containing alcohol dehydrogenase [Anaeroplasma bactoclasticum]
MNTFEYYTPTRMFFGREQEKKVGQILTEFQAKKILIHYGKFSVINSGLLDIVKNSLKEAQLDFLELGGVEPNPKLSLVEEGIKLVKKESVDFILAIGGGSVIDSAKSIAVGAFVDHSTWLFSTHEMTPKKAIPLGVILTLAASGSDMSDSCVITNDKTKEKRGFNSLLNRPKFAILNPELTYSVSPYQTACGIVDIMMHTLERFISIGNSTEPTDSIAIGLLKSVYQAGQVVMKDPKNYEARATLLWANSLSHNGLTSCGRSFVMSVHQLEHEVSGMFDYVAHGAGLAVLWPAWAKVSYPFAKDRFKRFVYEVLDIQPTDSVDKDILNGIKKLKDYFKEIGMPTSLKELNITEDDIQKLAFNVTFNHTRIIRDIIEIDEAMALKIYREAL